MILKFARAVQIWDLNTSSKQDLNFLMLSKLLAVSKELFHAVIVVDFQEIFKTVFQAKLLVSIGQHTDIDNGEQVASTLFQVLRGAPDDYDELLLGLGAQFESDTLR